MRRKHDIYMHQCNSIITVYYLILEALQKDLLYNIQRLLFIIVKFKKEHFINNIIQTKVLAVK